MNGRNHWLMRVFHLTPWKLKLLFGELDGISIGDVSVFGDWSHVEDVIRDQVNYYLNPENRLH